MNVVLLGWLALNVGPETEALPDARPLLDVVADPDEPRFSYGTIGPRSRSTFGSHLGLVGFRTQEHRIILALSPLLELSNISGQPISWQSFRANVGLNVLWSPPLAHRRRLVVHTGFFHESDHVADLETYRESFLADPVAPLDNGNFSSFEYLKVRGDFSQGWLVARGLPLTLVVSPGLRVFTPNFNRGDSRGDVLAVQNEIRFDVAWLPQVSTWVAAYGEIGLRNFEQTDLYRAAHSGPPVSRRLLLGVTARHRGPARFVFQIGYDNSNGRGVDFMRRWGHAVTAEIAIYR